MELWIVRHAKAERPGPEWPDDRHRPLTATGLRQATRLAELVRRLEASFDRIFSSPWVRAAQTAEVLGVALGPGSQVDYLDDLTEGDPRALLSTLSEELGPDATRAAVVGHEPQLSALAALLVTGRGRGMPMRLGKGAALVLEGDPSAGGMRLRALLPASVVASLAGEA